MKIDRSLAIRQHLFNKGYSSISEIAGAIGASEPTVRRDLLVLEGEGTIIRTHGGARIAEPSGAEVAFEIREQINLPAKRAIGDAAYKLLRPGSTVFLDAGTTVLQLARRLRMNPLALRVFTNCLPVAQLLLPVTGLTVTLLGGMLRPQNASMVGMLAENALDQLWFDQLFLGVGAISPLAEIYSADEQEARLNTRMLTRTNTPIVLTDAGKFGHRLTYRVAALPPDAHIISDNRLGGERLSQLQDLGCIVTLTDPQ